jgi:hypothetical protein
MKPLFADAAANVDTDEAGVASLRLPRRVIDGLDKAQL